MPCVALQPNVQHIPRRDEELAAAQHPLDHVIASKPVKDFAAIRNQRVGARDGRDVDKIASAYFPAPTRNIK